MILPAKESSVILPELVEDSAGISLSIMKGHWGYYAVQQVPLVELISMREKQPQPLLGFPTCFALRVSHEPIPETNAAQVVHKLELWPAPDRDYTAGLEYCPARKQI